MTDVVVEYKRTRSIRPVTSHPTTLDQLKGRQRRKITPSKWNSRGDNRNVEAKARWLVHSYGLIEDAIDYAYHHMMKYQFNTDESAYVFWRGVYKWLRRHEDLARRAPQLVGL